VDAVDASIRPVTDLRVRIQFGLNGSWLAVWSRMPRRRQRNTGGLIFHVINRGVRKGVIFYTPEDYAGFFKLMVLAQARVPMRVHAVALMPNHWHLVLSPHDDGDLTRYVGWLSLTHACRWQRVHETRGTGPVYQGRFKAIPVQIGTHFVTVMRYVERNAVRAGLVSRAEDWPWCSASMLAGSLKPELHPWPMDKPANWGRLVNEPETEVALAAIRKCVAGGSPFGAKEWREETAAQLGWTSGIRPEGHPAARAESQSPSPGVVTGP